MTTTSYPAVGQNGLTETQWSVMYGDQDGIYEDYNAGGVSSCTLTRSGDIATVGTGRVKVNGYMLDITAAHDLSVPAVSSQTVYYICAMYDPTLNVADSSGNASPDGPCRLIVSAGPPVTTGGKVYTNLWSITRNPSQALTAATVYDLRQWRGPTFVLPALPSSSSPGLGSGIFPRGAHMWIVPTNGGGMHDHYVRDVSGTNLVWRSLLSESARSFPASSGLVANTNSAQFFFFAGSMIKLRGTLKRSSGTISQGSNDVLLGVLPAGCRPAFTERFLCKVGSGKNYIEVRVYADGTVVMTGETGVDWIDLSPISFRAEN